MDQNRFTFNMDQIGRRISELRKKQNITQMGLADKLGISFQAVSNWERGNTMPDISKLPELAQIFNVTTDDLLGETSGLLRSAAKGELEQYMENNPVTMEELAEAAPLLLPNQTEEGFEKLTQDKPLPSLREIESILPFIGSELADELALKYADSTEWTNLDSIVPFVSRQALEQIVDRKVEAGEFGVIKICLPFLVSETVVSLALKIYEKEGARAVMDFMPFLPQETRQDIAQREYKRDGMHGPEDLSPFLDRDYLDRKVEAGEFEVIKICLPFLVNETVVSLALKIYEKEGSRAVVDFMPFLPQETRQDIAQREYKRDGMHGLKDLAPFLDRDYLTRLAKEALEKDGIKAISPIAPFLDQEMLTQFISEKYL